MKILTLVVALISGLTFAGSENTQKESSNGAWTAKVSSMGYGIEYTHPIDNEISLSFGVNKYSGSKKQTESDIKYDADIDFKSLSIIANYQPFNDGFRIRGGVYNNLNEIKLHATGNNLNIGGTNYNTTVNTTIDFDKVAPYLGIGYGIKPSSDNNIAFDFDLGIIKTGIGVDFNATGVAQADIDKETKELTDALDKLDVYPVISIGLSIAF